VTTAMKAATCRGCGTRVALAARVCVVCKAPDPTIGRATKVGPERAGRRLPFWLAAGCVLLGCLALIALASLLRG
jgi:hypothetical protein